MGAIISLASETGGLFAPVPHELHESRTACERQNWKRVLGAHRIVVDAAGKIPYTELNVEVRVQAPGGEGKIHAGTRPHGGIVYRLARAKVSEGKRHVDAIAEQRGGGAELRD